MRRLFLLVSIIFVGCATPGHTEPADPAPSSRVAAPRVAGEPEIVYTGKTFKLGYPEAVARYAKGERCGGGDAPSATIGEPDQHNEMQIGKDRVVTWGFRFRQGTLLIRCRADRVEVARTLK